ncbi:MAG: steroid 5-alpha reductase family enzyme, partial [Polyangiales bacterium]
MDSAAMNDEKPTLSRSAGFARITAAYVVAGAGALCTWLVLYVGHESFGMASSLEFGAAMDVVATVVVFLFSVALRNSSAYDAYWSVAPMALAAYWAALGEGTLVRVVLVVGLVWWWGGRLTWNWARTWTGLDHEDWRYVDLRRKTGAAWPLVNFFGIHFFPTVQVFLGLLPVHAALTIDAPLGIWDGVAVLITALAVLIEQVSDRQLLDFRRSPDRVKGDVMNTGLWAYSRHPNYVGESLFWWGLAFFTLQVAPSETWRWSGAAAITIMFVVISIPMIEERNKARRANYEERAAR